MGCRSDVRLRQEDIDRTFRDMIMIPGLSLLEPANIFKALGVGPDYFRQFLLREAGIDAKDERRRTRIRHMGQLVFARGKLRDQLGRQVRFADVAADMSSTTSLGSWLSMAVAFYLSTTSVV